MAWGSGRSGASATAVAAVVLVAVTVLVLSAWVSSTGSREVFREEVRPGPPGAAESFTKSPPEVAENVAGEDEGPVTPPRWTRILALLVQASVVLVALILLARLVLALRNLRIPRLRRPVEPVHVDFDLIGAEQVQDAAEAVLADAEEQAELLAQGSPRNGIVACWHRFEEQAQSVGLGRSPWETSSEFTMRLLDAVSTDDTAVAELAGLYREARFSDHPVGEDERAAAAGALQRVRAGVLVSHRRPS